MIVAPPPPEPVPDSLDESVDWMTYSHEEMYRMVHSGLDLTSATSVSADWARLGEALGEIGEELNRIVQAFADAWQGDAADQAVHAVGALAGWAGDAGTLATQVSGCITVELDNAMRARNAMPAPMAPPPPRPQPGPIPIAMPADGTLAGSAFTGGDFSSAPGLLSDQNGIVSQRHAAHQQAAETMEQFQTDSREVYHTVPAFSAPKIGTKPPGGPENPPAPPQPTPPQQAPGDPAPVRGPAVVSGPVAAPGPVGGPVAGPRPVASPGPQHGAVPAEPERPGAAPAASAGAAAPRSGGAQLGGMPMGGGGGGRKEEDLERKSPAYIKEDEDLWGLDEQTVAPPVIGEDQGRRA